MNDPKLYVPLAIQELDFTKKDADLTLADWIMFAEAPPARSEDGPPVERYHDYLWLKGRRNPTWYVNLYRVTREYGGPEEGGWYFNVFTPDLEIPSIPMGSYERAYELQQNI